MFHLASDKFNLADLAMGSTVMAVFHLVPDDMMSWGVKISLSLVTAFCGGFAAHAGKALWTKLTKKPPRSGTP